MRLCSRFSVVIAAICLAVSGAAFGSGFSIFEQGAKASAMGGAFAATADDPSAIFYNVAGIAQQRQFAVNLGGTAINFSNEFRGDPHDPFTSGQTAEYRRHTFIPPNAYVILPVGQNLTLGVGVFTAYGLRTNWKEPWAGRFISRDANLKTASVEPAVAWQTSDGRFALGVGAEYRRSHVTLDRNNAALNPFNQRFVDVVNAHLNSDWNSDWGWNVGVLLKPSSHWRFGASYRAKITIDYKGDGTFTQIPVDPRLDPLVKASIPPNQPIRTAINYPATAIIGVATTIIPKWDIEADATHTTWSRFKNLDILFEVTPASNLHRPQNWHNTWSYRLGGNRRVTDDWDVRLGTVYDENPQPTEGVGPLLPDSDRFGFTFGLGFHRGPWVIDATEFVLHFKKRGTMGVSLDNFNGTYKTDANLISFNMGYKF